MDTTKKYIRHLSLCTGYGGIDLGLKRVLPALRTCAYVEVEAFCCATLVDQMEQGNLDPAPIWTDVKTMPLEAFPKGLEILSGGFPCPPFSQAGNRNADDDPRHLFPYIKNAIRTIQPRLIFLENVEGLISSKLKSDNWSDPAGTPVLLHVLRELEREGYECAWGVFSASEEGAPMLRKRVFILGHLADSDCAGDSGSRDELGISCTAGQGRENPAEDSNACPEVSPEGEQLAFPSSFFGNERLSGSGGETDEEQRLRGKTGTSGSQEELGNADQPRPQGHRGKHGLREGSQEGQTHGSSDDGGEVGQPHGERELQPEGSQRTLGGRDSNSSLQCGELANANSSRGFKDWITAELRPSGVEQPSSYRWPARPGQAQKGWEEPRVTAGGKAQKEQQAAQSELGGATDGPTESGVDTAIDTVENRLDRLRMLGNGCVPSTVARAFTVLWEELNQRSLGENNDTASNTRRSDGRKGCP